MNKNSYIVLLLLFIGGIALGAVYKWVDESGRVHYGDSPPSQPDAQKVEVPEGPTQEEVEKAQQQMQERIEQYEGIYEQIRPPEQPGKTPLQKEKGEITPDKVACFSPLPGVIQGPSAKAFTPITPTSLTKPQQKTLINLFSQLKGFLQGTISDMTCMGSASAPRSEITNYEARTRADWDSHKSRLTLETDYVGRDSHAVERVIHRYKVSGVLYFSDYKQADIIELEGNKVEVLNITPNTVSFIIKRRIAASGHARRLRVETRNLEIHGRAIKYIERYYHNELLTGSREWVLDR